MHHGRSLLAIFGLSVAPLLHPRLTAQSCPPEPPPLTAAPIPGLDGWTALLGSFDSTPFLAGPGGSVATKVTMPAGGAGIFGTHALEVPAAQSVAIYPSAGFPLARGTIELWARPPAAPGGPRACLFSLRGAASLDGDAFADLIVGETTEQHVPAASRVYFQSAAGLDLESPATFTTFAPRGIAVGDVDGDGDFDLVVASNAADDLAVPATPVPGEVHVYAGPIAKAGAIGPPVTVLEVNRPQGLALADLDRDGFLDLAVASYDPSTDPIAGFENDGSGSFGSFEFEFEEPAAAEVVAAGDVDQDGVLDLLYSSFDVARPSRIMIGRSHAPGSYQIGGAGGVQYKLAAPALGASLGDVDGDGWLDAVLALTLLNAGVVAVHFNNGDGTFDQALDAAIPTPRPFTVNATRDLNQDGFLDLAVANWRLGLGTTPVSTVFYGPISTALPPSASFLVDDAVAVAAGDLNGDGTDDLAFHSSASFDSPVFLLDWNGFPIGGVGSGGAFVPSFTFPAQPTQLNPNGEGAGMCVALGGTATYGSVHVLPNSFELSFANGKLTFGVSDSAGRRRAATVPFPPPGDAYAAGGFHHVQAEWDAAAGVVEIRAGHPALGVRATDLGAPFDLAAVAPNLRLGTDADNQTRAAGWSLDDFRVSTVRRSQLDFDQDGVQDEFDNCPFVPNPFQFDGDGDAIGNACEYCQQDLGFQGPGALVLSVCGQVLQPGAAAALRLRCGPPSAPCLLFVGASAIPKPFAGGTLLPAPPQWMVSTALDGKGELSYPVPGSGLTLEVYAQAVALGAGAATVAAISNAVKIVFPGA